VSLYQLRKETGVCTSCGGPPAPDSLLCETHRDAARASKRRWWRKATSRYRRAKVCVHCGGSRLRGDTSCLRCRVVRNRLSKVTPPEAVTVAKSVRLAAATRTHADGRERYHGQQRRGQQTHAALNRQDIQMASESFAAFRTALALLDSDEAKAWPRGERQHFAAAAASHGERVGRHLDDVLERIGHFGQVAAPLAVPGKSRKLGA